MNFWAWLEKRIETRDDVLPEQVDVIIGLGMDVSPDGTKPSPQSRAVAMKVLELFQQGKAENVLFTGGFFHKDGPTEAELMAPLVADSVLSGNLFLETESWITYQNARFSRLIMKHMGWKRAIVVAHQWQARRARQTFKKRWGKEFKLYVVKAPSPYGDGSMRRLRHPVVFWLFDTLAFLFSYLRGYC